MLMKNKIWGLGIAVLAGCVLLAGASFTVAQGPESPDEVITYIALGIWGEYAAILPEVYRRAQELGLGHRLPQA